MRKVDISTVQSEGVNGLARPSPTQWLCELNKLGLSDTKWCGAYHGTSMEALEYARTHGFIPGSLNPESSEKYIYVLPIREKLLRHPLAKEIRFCPTKQALRLAIHYANALAQDHYLMQKLDLNVNDPCNRELASSIINDPEEPETAQFFQRLGQRHFTREWVERTALDAMRRKGVILGLSRTIFRGSGLEVSPGDSGEPDAKIHVPDGLSVNYITGIWCLGSQEKSYFRRLERSLRIGTKP